MKVVVDRSRCTGHARCNAIAGQLYELSEEGYIDSDGFDVPLGMEKAAFNGARACPERAIRTMGHPGGSDWPPSQVPFGDE